MFEFGYKIFLTCLFAVGVSGQYEWQARDPFDEISRAMQKVNKDNCEIQHVGDLYLPEDTVSHLPDIKDVNINPVFPNRTQLLHLHNMAMNRAFFWSYILQSRFIRPAINDTYDPGMMYYFLSTVADVSTNKHINASAIYFSPNMAYSSSYKGFFNKTFPRFAPRTFRSDNLNNLNTFTVNDLGAIAPDTSNDYTLDSFKINEWYKEWLPDIVGVKYDRKTMYRLQIRYANNKNETFIFHGPPGADENPGPVKWTRPYFDCGRSNRWLVAAVVPIADIYPRHTGFRHIEYPVYTAISVLEMDFEKLDINQCPTGNGNEGPNKFADTSRCKKETTKCEPLHGWGFQRGGYQCRCRPGFRLPTTTKRPFLGEIVERKTSDEFNCIKIKSIQELPYNWDKSDRNLREQVLDQYPEYRNQIYGLESLNQPKLNINRVLDFIFGMRKDNCGQYKPADLVLSKSAMYGAEEFFENEAKMALRLANFISAYLQVSKDDYSGKRVEDRDLTDDQIIGETVALLLGNTRIWSAGTYWERNKFPNKTLFATYAYKKELNSRTFYVEDLAPLENSDEVYLNKPWYTFLKHRWASNFDSLEKIWMKIRIRLNETGENTIKYEKFPTYYRGARLEHGYWSQPYYDCHGKVPMWKIKYVAPFFGWDSVKAKLEFKGAVAITVDLLRLDINQCPGSDHELNAFKGTDKCDQKSSLCVPVEGRGYDFGGYNCECKPGYEYPFEDQITYFDGQLIEAEFDNLVNDTATRFNIFKCRSIRL